MRDRHAFVSGRWDGNLAVVNLDAALTAGRHAGAIVSRPRVTSGAGDTAPPGLPVAVVSAPVLGRVAVINHTGNASRAEVGALPHGHAGTVAVLDCARAIDPAGDGRADALIGTIPVGPGPVGAVLLPDGRHMLVSSSEGDGTEDGGHILSLVDIATCTHVTDFTLAHGGAPSAAPSPDEGFGNYPNPCGIAFTPAHGGIVLVANGGSADVSVIPLANIIARKPMPESGRVGIACGGFGIAVDAEGKLAAVCNRENPRTGENGSAITLIDVRAARDHPETARLADIAVGGPHSRPTGAAFSPCGTKLYVSCADSGAVSLVDVEDRRESVRKHLDLDQAIAMPRGIAATGDGRHVVVAGGKKGAPGSSSLWILDAGSLDILARVPGVGNESYFLSML